MAGTDISFKDRASPSVIVGSDPDGTENYPVGASLNGELKTTDTIGVSAIDTILTVTTIATEGKVGVTVLPNRKYIWMQAITVPAGPNGFILWGFSNLSQSFKLFKDQMLCFPIGEGVQVWFKTQAGSGSVAFGEGE